MDEIREDDLSSPSSLTRSEMYRQNRGHIIKVPKSDRISTSKLYFIPPFIFSIGTCVVMATALASTNWETVKFDHGDLVAAVNITENVDIFRPQGGSNEDDIYFTITITTAVSPNTTNVTMVTTYVPVVTNAGLWQRCDSIPDDVRQVLREEGSTIEETSCTWFPVFASNGESSELSSAIHFSMGFTRSAQSCSLVAAIVLFVSIALGAVVCANPTIILMLLSGICSLASSLYQLFLIILMLLRMTYSHTAKDLDKIIAEAEQVEYGWSYLAAWTAFGAGIVTGIMWITVARITTSNMK
ncbi:unnamed protein product [Owenia fusiformis]|uniref:Uncharacterized protein n=1 Tax=Owenia fusiformis TaxID=6347 RepID=A0A8J1UL68_OWEFU|nr:unnamed protein product [Owenia fusiformis]